MDRRGALVRLRKHPLGRTLPLLLLVGIGGLLWRSDWVAQERVLALELGPAEASLKSLEVQVCEPSGAILERTIWTFDQGVPTEVTVKLTARSGEYRVRTFLSDGVHQASASQTLTITHDERYSLPVAPR